jgi:hypothetical protein
MIESTIKLDSVYGQDSVVISSSISMMQQMFHIQYNYNATKGDLEFCREYPIHHYNEQEVISNFLVYDLSKFSFLALISSNIR